MAHDDTGLGGDVLGPVLRVLNELVTGGLLMDYAIGSGVGVLYYVEPVSILDRYGLW